MNMVNLCLSLSQVAHLVQRVKLNIMYFCSKEVGISTIVYVFNGCCNQATCVLG